MSIRRAPAVLTGAVLLGVCPLAACGGAAAKTHPPPPTAAARPTIPAPTTTTTAPPVSYQVKPGDSLSKIAQQSGVTVAVIVALNHITDVNRLSVGQTLLIPAPPAAGLAHLAISPTHGTAGQTFTFVVTGAGSAETITFTIDAPTGGGTFTGPPHTASPAGAVTAFYATNGADAPGTYTVTATGDRHSTAKATFMIDAPSGPQ